MKKLVLFARLFQRYKVFSTLTLYGYKDCIYCCVLPPLALIFHETLFPPLDVNLRLCLGDIALCTVCDQAISLFWIRGKKKHRPGSLSAPRSHLP